MLRSIILTVVAAGLFAVPAQAYDLSPDVARFVAAQDKNNTFAYQVVAWGFKKSYGNNWGLDYNNVCKAPGGYTSSPARPDCFGRQSTSQVTILGAASYLYPGTFPRGRFKHVVSGRDGHCIRDVMTWSMEKSASFATGATTTFNYNCA